MAEQILSRAKKKRKRTRSFESTDLSVFHAYNYVTQLLYNFSREVELCKRVLVTSSFPCLGSFVKAVQVCCTVHNSRCKRKQTQTLVSFISSHDEFLITSTGLLILRLGLLKLPRPELKNKKKIPLHDVLVYLARTWRNLSDADTTPRHVM